MKLGIIDADLLDNGTRHPNLACMKIAAYYLSQGWKVSLLENYENLNKYDLIMISRVFSFTKIPSVIFKDGKDHSNDEHPEKYLKKNIQNMFLNNTPYYYSQNSRQDKSDSPK